MSGPGSVLSSAPTCRKDRPGLFVVFSVVTATDPASCACPRGPPSLSVMNGPSAAASSSNIGGVRGGGYPPYRWIFRWDQRGVRLTGGWYTGQEHRVTSSADAPRSPRPGLVRRWLLPRCRGETASVSCTRRQALRAPAAPSASSRTKSTDPSGDLCCGPARTDVGSGGLPRCPCGTSPSRGSCGDPREGMVHAARDRGAMPRERPHLG